MSLFTFVPTIDFCDPHPSRYRVGQQQVTQFFNRTTVVNNYEEWTAATGASSTTGLIRAESPPSPTRKFIRSQSVTHQRPVTHGEQLGRDGRTLMVNRPNFAIQSPAERQGHLAAHRDNFTSGRKFVPTAIVSQRER